nr:pentapeptide repeat-containing protein [uncultured Allomuricauda sp.]
MQKPFIADKEYIGRDYSQVPLPKAEYEHCVFRNCIFSNGFLDNQTFMECEFIDCDLTNANIKHTTFKECSFSDSKLIGLRFEDCDTLFLSMGFTNCNLGFASFFELSLPKTFFGECSFEQTDFTETNLTASTFHNCNLEKAVFHQTVLEKADFTTAFNFTIDLEKNHLKKARFSKENSIGLLKKYDIVIT